MVFNVAETLNSLVAKVKIMVRKDMLGIQDMLDMLDMVALEDCGVRVFFKNMQAKWAPITSYK